MHLEKSIYQNLLQWFILATVFLLPVFFLPVSIMSLYSIKIAIFVTLGLASLIVFLSGLLVNGHLSLPKQKMVLFLALVPMIALVSSFVNGNFTKSFIGNIFEINTASFLVMAVFFALIATVSIKEEETLFKVIKSFVLATCLILLVIFLKILTSYGFLPSSLLASFPDYLSVGSIDTLIVLGGAMFLVINAFMFGEVRGKAKQVIMGIIIGGSLLFAGALGFKAFIILVALFSLMHFIYTISLSKMSRANSDNNNEDNSPLLHPSTISNSSLVSLVLLVLSLVLILGGNTFSSFLSKTLRISNVDVRPNFSTSLELVGSAWQSNPVLGIGPNNFSNLWNAHKPIAVNVTDFWNTDFKNSFSYILTFMAEVGPLGSLALIIFLILFVRSGFKGMFIQNLDHHKRFLFTSLFLVSLYFWVMAFLYTVGIVVLGVTFVLTGVSIASLGILQIGDKKEFNIFGNPKLNFISIFILVVLLLFSVSVGFFVWEKLVASAIFNRGERMISVGNIEGALDPLVKSALIASSDAYWRGVANTYTAILQNKISSLDPNAQIDANTRTELQNYIGSSIKAAENAISIDNKNYLNHFVLGNVYETLGRVGIEGALNNAEINYEEAKRLSPRNPGILLMLARLAVLEGNNEMAFQNINKALILKSNFTEALFLKAQIEVANNNIVDAIKSVEDATLIDPSNAGLYFQLGLLKYNQKDWSGASSSFERAINLVGDYANAKYFLGLSLSMLSREVEAIKQFEDLQISNPTNTEIKFILQNLKAGRDPFANVKPPVDNKPEKRVELPIEE